MRRQIEIFVRNYVIEQLENGRRLIFERMIARLGEFPLDGQATHHGAPVITEGDQRQIIDQQITSIIAMIVNDADKAGQPLPEALLLNADERKAVLEAGEACSRLRVRISRPDALYSVMRRLKGGRR